MYVITHALAPIVLAGLAQSIALERTEERALRGPHFLAIGLAGASPDLMSPHLSLAARYSSWSHTVWFLLFGAAVLWWIANRWFTTERQMMWGWMVLGVGLHLFYDAIAGGIAWAYPYSDNIVGRYYVHWDWWLESDIFHLVTAGGLLLWLRQRERQLLSRPYR